MRKRIGVVADDVTGANDIGIMFRNGGYKSAVFPLKLIGECTIENEIQGLDVIIIDTDSRFDNPQTAAEKVQRATEILQSLSCQRYFNKTCSVFRGNIGAEFDRMQDILGIKTSMVIAGFPKNGRTTIDGIHYVYGTKLEESQFKNDPIHPMNTSSLKEIMEQQTDRPIGLVSWKDLDQGLEAVLRKKEELKQICSYVLFDVRDQKDLELIAEAIADEVNVCGSSAIGEELPGAYEKMEKPEESVLVLAGSLTMQSIAQTENMRERGYSVFELDTESVISKDAEKLQANIVQKAENSLNTVGVAMIHSSQDSEKVKATKAAGKAMGMTDEEIGQQISKALCSMARKIMEEVSCRKILVAGGDTSAAVTEELGIYKMEIEEEIEPGIPMMRGKSKLGEIDLVLKSGSFGSREFLTKAAECLKRR